MHTYPYSEEEETRRPGRGRFVAGLVLGLLIGLAIGLTVSRGAWAVREDEAFTIGWDAITAAIFSLVVLILAVLKARSRQRYNGGGTSHAIILGAVLAGLLLLGLVFTFYAVGR